MKTVAFYTLGCKVNQYETQAMRELFSDAGYEEAGFTERAACISGFLLKIKAGGTCRLVLLTTRRLMYHLMIRLRRRFSYART